jgi:hypothetical protein
VSAELQQAGVTIESSNLDAKSISVRFDPDLLSRTDLETVLEAIGFPTVEGHHQ